MTVIHPTAIVVFHTTHYTHTHTHTTHYTLHTTHYTHTHIHTHTHTHTDTLTPGSALYCPSSAVPSKLRVLAMATVMRSLARAGKRSALTSTHRNRVSGWVSEWMNGKVGIRKSHANHPVHIISIIFYDKCCINATHSLPYSPMVRSISKVVPRQWRRFTVTQNK